jgi:hypothetical protein
MQIETTNALAPATMTRNGRRPLDLTPEPSIP